MKMLILQTFMNIVIDNKLGKDDKDKRVDLKCQAFISRVVRMRVWAVLFACGLILDSEGLWCQAGFCVIVYWYLQKSMKRMEDGQQSLKSTVRVTFSMVVLKNYVVIWECCCDWSKPGIDCAESAAVIGWILRHC